MALRSLIARGSPTGLAFRDPFALFTRDMDRLLQEAFGRTLANAPMADYGAGLKLDVTENEKEVTVTAECAGVDEKDIDVAFNDGVLTIKGEKKFEKDEKTETLHLVERSYGSFSRSIAIPAEISADKIEATFAKGVLTIALPKQAKAIEKAKKIEIKTA
jgi:HSP20 family protein